MSSAVASAAPHPILVVDDEPHNLELIERHLRRKYTPIYKANDGEEGLALLGKHRVDLILADQRMPKLFGTELLAKAREIQPEAMRVLVTGFGDIETLTAAINACQAFQIVSKPIDLHVMDMVVKRALEARQAALRERELFEAFVYASVNAIEQRDPSTAGHSFRVAAMTTGLAMVVDGLEEGPFREVKFSRDDIEQIKYASLLHDFGKIGVREVVLLKSHKLPPNRREILEHRLRDAVRRGLPAEQADRFRTLLTLLNDPEISASAHEHELREIEASGIPDPEDVAFLRIERGSLSSSERVEIESHVAGTISFLKQIPWPHRLGRVVEIAGSHHETLNGRGYPYGKKEIPLEAQLMTVCDIYDALVAADRPYKPAVLHDRAVDILMSMAKNGSIDRAILDCFVARKVYRALRGRPDTVR